MKYLIRWFGHVSVVFDHIFDVSLLNQPQWDSCFAHSTYTEDIIDALHLYCLELYSSLCIYIYISSNWPVWKNVDALFSEQYFDTDTLVLYGRNVLRRVVPLLSFPVFLLEYVYCIPAIIMSTEQLIDLNIQHTPKY